MKTENIKNELNEMPMNTLEKIAANLSFGLVIGGVLIGGTIGYETKDASNLLFYGLAGTSLGNIPIGIAAINYSLRARDYKQEEK